jgi:O-acetyl-ADP-ribose deacetylase (regulator of RNase III)
MGAGVAVAFKEKFPNNYSAYRNACLTGLLQPGEAYVFKEGGNYIANIASQKTTGPNAGYNWLLTGAMDAAMQLSDFYGQNRLAIPMIGCGIGGLEWLAVQHILQAVEIMIPGFEFEVWKL